MNRSTATKKRSLVKALTWRLTATTDTVVIAWIITNKFSVGLAIGGMEVITKLVLYYLHERLWNRTALGVTDKANRNSRKRSIIKTVTWRVTGTLDTILLAWLITGKLSVGLKIGGIEVLTKMVLYYFHERIWGKSKFGVVKEANPKTI